MPRLFLRAVAVLTAFLATLAALAGSASAGSALTAGPAIPAGRQAVPPGRPVPAAPVRLLLIDGVQALVRAGADGIRTADILRGGRGLAGAVQLLRLGSREFLIPMAALPYLGHGLSLSLFELGTLERAERRGRLPVTIRYQGRLHAPPGVTVTRAGPGLADGYLTPAGARRFGASLVRQLAADHSRASYGADGLFAGGLSIALPGTAITPAVRPRFPMHTLTVTAANLEGRPDTGDAVEVFDLSDPDALNFMDSTNFFDHGSVKYSVPDGTYWALGSFLQTFRHGAGAVIREDVVPQFTVRGDTAVHLSERAATGEVTFATLRRAVLRSDLLMIDRGTPANSTVTELVSSPPAAMWISPVTRAPSVGFLHVFTQGWLTSPRQPGVPYAYSLDQADPEGHILADQHYVARPADLATIRETYYQDVASTTGGGFCTAGGTAFQLGARGAFVPCGGGGLALPGRQVEYFSASPAMYWSTRYWEHGDLTGGQQDAWRLLHAGQYPAQDWNRYPLRPAPDVSLTGSSGPFDQAPSAFRAGNLLSLNITPFSDSTYGDTGTGYYSTQRDQVTGRYAIYQNGERIAGGDAIGQPADEPEFGVDDRLSARPSVIRLVLTASRASARYRLSAASRDVWTWRTRREPAATVPTPWFCGIGPAGLDRRCVVQGMLTLRYFVAGLSLSGTTRPGRQSIGLIVGHLQQAPGARITSARAQVSFTSGRRWQQATVSRSAPGRFRVVFRGRRGLVTLRVTARDAAGDTITETLTGAYRISA